MTKVAGSADGYKRNRGVKDCAIPEAPFPCLILLPEQPLQDAGILLGNEGWELTNGLSNVEVTIDLD